MAKLAGGQDLTLTSSEQQATFEVLEALLKKDRVYLPDASRAMDLRERGFGELRGEKLFLTPYEAFYLLEKGRVKVSQASTGEITFRELVQRFSHGKPELWIKYLVYRDLRDRGYIARESRPVDFEVYGKGALRRLVFIVYEGAEASLKTLGRLVNFSSSEKKELILAVIDRRTDIVYYSLRSLLT